MPALYQNRIVAYIDILGFTELIKQTINENDPEFAARKLNILYGIVKNIRAYMSAARNKRHLSGNCAVTMFSDTIIFSQPKTESLGVLAMFDVIKRLQINMLQKGILLRGGIVYGKLVHNDEIILGPALINAYNVESKSAVYPRIVIDPKVTWLYIRKDGKPIGQKRIKDFADDFLFTDDFDGTYYIDYFNEVESYLTALNLSEYYSTIKNMITKGKKSDDTGIRMKYLWMEKKLKEAIELD